MKTSDAIRYVLNSSQRILTSFVNDLSDEELLVRPVQGANHVAWQLGHLIGGEHKMLEGVAPGKAAPLPADFANTYAAENSSSDNPSEFLSKKEYLNLFSRQREATLAVLEDLTEEGLGQPSPERMRPYAPTVGAVLTLIGTHILMHAGQITVVRRKLKKPLVM